MYNKINLIIGMFFILLLVQTINAKLGTNINKEEIGLCIRKQIYGDINEK